VWETSARLWPSAFEPSVCVCWQSAAGQSSVLPAELGIYEVRGRSDLHQMLSEADFVIVCAKYDASIHHLIDEAAIAAMKRVYFL
jgi:phosphoglycerate dehydrogenase-like enzyme